LEERADRTQLRQALVFGSEEVNKVISAFIWCRLEQPKTPPLGHEVAEDTNQNTIFGKTH
jgi:hypothetical protein